MMITAKGFVQLFKSPQNFYIKGNSSGPDLITHNLFLISHMHKNFHSSFSSSLDSGVLVQEGYKGWPSFFQL